MAWGGGLRRAGGSELANTVRLESDLTPGRTKVITSDSIDRVLKTYGRLSV